MHLRQSRAERLIEWLESIHLIVKIISLVVITFPFFFFVFFISEEHLVDYFLILFALLLGLTFICYVVVESREFWFAIKLWLVGLVMYLIINIPYMLTGGPLSPYMELSDSFNRWLYVVALPVRILAIFLGGLIFLRITSPLEFTKYGAIGLQLTFLFRTIDYVKEAVYETKDALRMYGKWPDECVHKHWVKRTWTIIRYSPTLMFVTVRNVICWFFPWTWLFYKKMQSNIKGSKR